MCNQYYKLLSYFTFFYGSKFLKSDMQFLLTAQLNLDQLHLKGEVVTWLMAPGLDGVAMDSHTL